MGTIDTNTQTENSPENPPLRHCHLTSEDLTAHPRHMSHLPMYARYGPESMTEEDVTSLDLDGNTLAVQTLHLHPSAPSPDRWTLFLRLHFIRIETGARNI
jgi:hypothetical protein